MKELLNIALVMLLVWAGIRTYPQEQGYTVEQRAGMDKLLARELGLKRIKVSKAQPKASLAAQAKAYADLYGLTEADIAKPVDLWGAK